MFRCIQYYIQYYCDTLIIDLSLVFSTILYVVVINPVYDVQLKKCQLSDFVFQCFFNLILHSNIIVRASKAKCLQHYQGKSYKI